MSPPRRRVADPPSSRGTARPIDETLLAGFSFACRPDCGLCCYASPAIAASDVPGLLAIEPSFRPEGRPPGFIPSRSDGGACTFLRANRCRAHSARPGPCAEFPLSTHVGDRVQISVVLSCPGLGLGPLEAGWTTRSAGPTEIHSSLREERRAVERGLVGADPAEGVRASAEWNRALRSAVRRGEDPAIVVAEIRSVLHRDVPRPRADDLAAVPVPTESEGLERLPLFFDATFGRVAICSDDDRIELIRLRESGGIEDRLATFAYPERVPRLTSDGEQLLTGYLSYFLDRDAFIGSLLTPGARRAEVSLLEGAREDLREIAAAVVSRGIYRTWLRGGSAESLGAAEIGDGIRATDADYLDRPTVGRWR